MFILFSVSLFCTVLTVVANVRIWQTSRTSIELWWKTVISCVRVIFTLIHWWVLNNIYSKHLKNMVCKKNQTTYHTKQKTQTKISSDKHLQSNTSLKLNTLPCSFNLAWLHVMKNESVVISYSSFNFAFFHLSCEQKAVHRSATISRVE